VGILRFECIVIMNKQSWLPLTPWSVDQDFGHKTGISVVDNGKFLRILST